MEEILKTKDIVLSAGAELTVKISGCAALTDLRLTNNPESRVNDLSMGGR